MSPLVSAAMDKNLITARAYDQTETFEAGLTFARTEGLIPAPESCHAVKAAIDVALECKKAKKEKSIVFCMSGHGMLDLYGYEQFMDGTLQDSSI
jgi:tryptophan synthase beta chain